MGNVQTVGPNEALIVSGKSWLFLLIIFWYVSLTDNVLYLIIKIEFTIFRDLIIILWAGE